MTRERVDPELERRTEKPAPREGTAWHSRPWHARCVWWLVRTLCFVVLLAIAAPAAAQGRTRAVGAVDDDFASERADARALADARYLRDLGAGLTLGGIAVTGLGAGLMFGITGFENVEGIIAGGLFEGLGGLAGLIGIPMWIVGAVRAEAFAHGGSDRSRVGASYELAGLITTLTALGVGLVGGALVAIGIGLDATWPRDERALEAMRGWGAFVVVPVSAFVALFLGMPLSAAGAQF